MDLSVERLISIPYKEKMIEACVTLPKITKTSGYGVILTHGAGGDMNLLQLGLLSEHLASKGRSLGSRAAVGVANAVKGTELADTIAGVVALSYPLHTQDNKASLRDNPLFELSFPVCFISGTCDDMCDERLLKNVVGNVRNSEIKWIKGANHALKVKGSKEEDVVRYIGDYIYNWCETKFSGNIAETVEVKEAKKRKRKCKRNANEQKQQGSGKRIKSCPTR